MVKRQMVFPWSIRFPATILWILFAGASIRMGRGRVHDLTDLGMLAEQWPFWVISVLSFLIVCLINGER